MVISSSVGFWRRTQLFLEVRTSVSRIDYCLEPPMVSKLDRSVKFSRNYRLRFQKPSFNFRYAYRTTSDGRPPVSGIGDIPDFPLGGRWQNWQARTLVAVNSLTYVTDCTRSRLRETGKIALPVMWTVVIRQNLYLIYGRNELPPSSGWKEGRAKKQQEAGDKERAVTAVTTWSRALSWK